MLHKRLTYSDIDHISVDPDGEGEEKLAGDNPDPTRELVVDLLNVLVLHTYRA